MKKIFLNLKGLKGFKFLQFLRLEFNLSPSYTWQQVELREPSKNNRLFSKPKADQKLLLRV